MLDSDTFAAQATGGHDRRARVRAVLERRRLNRDHSPGDASASWLQERFVARAQALFAARLMFLSLGLLILAVPAWAGYFGLNSAFAFAGYFTMLLYSVANYLVIGHPSVGRVVTYVTLCFDLIIVVILIARPQTGAGLQSPLLATQLLFTTLFAILFPKPLAIMPPMLALPITTRLDQLLDRSPTAVELLTIFWYLALNVVIIYVIVFLNGQEVAAHGEIVELQNDLRELAVVEERNRLAREIHDGLGASLSSLIIQSEYLLQLCKDDSLREEIGQLKTSAEESIEELRRSLRMMREDFDLTSGLADYVKTFSERTQLKVLFSHSGREERLPPATHLTLFRVLQEALSNAAKHAQAQAVEVRLGFAEDQVTLTVRDDGRGFEPGATKHGHYGLLNMKERAQSAGGTLLVDSAPGKGSLLAFTIPLNR